MNENIIFKLKALQSVEPEEAWVAENKRNLMERLPAFGVKNDVFLSSANIFGAKHKFSLNFLVPRHLAISFTSLVVVLASGIITVGASQSSLPGEALYPVKKVGEQVALAVASEENKPKVEIEQAGKRLEELAQISQKSSDVDQQAKVEQLVAEFESKVNSANERLSQLSDKGKGDSAMKDKVVSAAQVVTAQSEKYSEVLAKTTESMPGSMKDSVADSVASATKTTEKTNMGALMVIVEAKNDGQLTEDETSKVQKRIEKMEESLKSMETSIISEKSCSEAENDKTVLMQRETQKTEETANCTKKEDLDNKKELIAEAKKELEEAKNKMNGKDLIGSLNVLASVTERVARFETGDFTREENGSVAGDSTEGDLPSNSDEQSGATEGSNSKEIESGSAVVDGVTASE
jgi:hypothetical protein